MKRKTHGLNKKQINTQNMFNVHVTVFSFAVMYYKMIVGWFHCWRLVFLCTFFFTTSSAVSSGATRNTIYLIFIFAFAFLNGNPMQSCNASNCMENEFMYPLH